MSPLTDDRQDWPARPVDGRSDCRGGPAAALGALGSGG